MLENPIILAALICFLLGLVLSGLVRLVRSSAIASTVLPIIFLASYVLTYQQVPTFPPVGSTNKIFYIALAAALIGFALDLLSRTANYRKLLAPTIPTLRGFRWSARRSAALASRRTSLVRQSSSPRIWRPMSPAPSSWPTAAIVQCETARRDHANHSADGKIGRAVGARIL